jgi:hypothetical protein
MTRVRDNRRLNAEPLEEIAAQEADGAPQAVLTICDHVTTCSQRCLGGLGLPTSARCLW